MKMFFTLLILCFSFSVFSSTVKIKQNVHFRGKQKKNATLCKQKEIPVKAIVEYSQNMLTIYLSPEKKLRNFSILGIREIDKVKIGRYQEIKNIDLNVNEEVETQVEISSLSGQAYLSLDLGYEVNGSYQTKSLAVPVGTVTAEQKREWQKNVKMIQKKIEQTPGGMSVKTENVHYMQLPK